MNHEVIYVLWENAAINRGGIHQIEESIASFQQRAKDAIDTLNLSRVQNSEGREVHFPGSWPISSLEISNLARVGPWKELLDILNEQW